MRTLVLLAVAVLALTACGPKQAAKTCAPGHKCLHIGNIVDPESIDPQHVGNKNDDNVVGNLMMGLTTGDVNDNAIPGMATSWETSADGKVWTFHLREAVWSDGHPFTADDFVFGIRRVLDPKTASSVAYLIYFIEGAQAFNEGKAPADAVGVKALDPRTLQIRLNHPVPYLPQMAKHHSMFPAPRHIVEQYGDDWTEDHYVSNGAYTYESWRLGDRLKMIKNPRFWDAANVCLDELYFYPTSDSIAAERRVLRGELDWNNDIQSNRIPRLRREAPDFVQIHTTLATTYLAFRANDPKFKDVRVRRALSMAVDREFITSQLLRGGQKPAFTFIPPGIANYGPAPTPYWAAWSYERRKAEARRLLAEAGYSPARPLKFEITHRNTSDPSLFMPAIQADWAEIGAQVSLQPLEGQIAYQSYRARAFQMADAAWSGDYDDPKTFLDQMRTEAGQMNYADYSNPAYDALIDQSDNEPDPVKRAAILARAEALMLADAPIIPLYFWVNKNLVSPKVTGFGGAIMDNHRARWMCVKG
jgi:oligopeptide transport system substrate-binding protein